MTSLAPTAVPDTIPTLVIEIKGGVAEARTADQPVRVLFVDHDVSAEDDSVRLPSGDYVNIWAERVTEPDPELVAEFATAEGLPTVALLIDPEDTLDSPEADALANNEARNGPWEDGDDTDSPEADGLANSAARNGPWTPEGTQAPDDAQAQLTTEEAIAAYLFDGDAEFNEGAAADAGREILQLVLKNISASEYAALRRAFELEN